MESEQVQESTPRSKVSTMCYLFTAIAACLLMLTFWEVVEEVFDEFMVWIVANPVKAIIVITMFYSAMNITFLPNT